MRLVKKINAARRVWGSPPELTPARVAEALAPWWKGR